MRQIVIALVTVALLAAAWAGRAEQGPGRGDRGERTSSSQRDDDRSTRDRDNDRSRGRRGHLSPEDRRQLRRDIYDHGRDIYRDRGRDRR